MKPVDWLLICLTTIVFCGVALTTKRAHSHDPLTHANDLSEARSEAFGSCCDGTDFLRVTLWERTETGFRIFVHGKWMEAGHTVKVNNMQNPDGEAKVWVNGPKDAPYVRCFMPGVLT